MQYIYGPMDLACHAQCTICYNFEWGTGRCKYVSGYVFTTLFCEGCRYLPWLTERFLAAGGIIRGRSLSSLKVLRSP